MRRSDSELGKRDERSVSKVVLFRRERTTLMGAIGPRPYWSCDPLQPHLANELEICPKGARLRPPWQNPHSAKDSAH